MAMGKPGTPWQPMRPARRVPQEFPPHIQKLMKDSEDERDFRGMWINDRYVVTVFERKWMNDGVITELSIRRQDREYPRDWHHFQRIKNEICGPEREACELFPRESRLVDGANQFHLYVLPEGLEFPFGYSGPRTVLNGDEEILRGVGGKQRPLGEMS